MMQKICLSLDEQGINEKNMYLSKEQLIKQFLIIKNPIYVPGIYKNHIDFTKCLSHLKNTILWNIHSLVHIIKIHFFVFH